MPNSRGRTREATGVRVSWRINNPNIEKKLLDSPQLRQQLFVMTNRVASLADQTCPTETGTLRRSQRVVVLDTPSGPVGVVSYLAFYAHMVHNGTVSAPANPWLLNALITVARRGVTRAQGQARASVA